MLKYILVGLCFVGAYALDLSSDCDGHYCGGSAQVVKKD
ncbi:Uncharacterised protein [Mannheimia haemolytica]|uniref:Uncharacterized protein n=1 Tax=Mannheimia haemolytica TaxID=75985 RepID=A0A378NHU7_MANHA|nr:hypothetical protein EDC41_12830 [Mannheimia haemolytica]STY50286.1 Uncharacterised protein [Mannheimia haemolytica]STY67315.1 Uncharacterised protein [Mannheimia haemolytica]